MKLGNVWINEVIKTSKNAFTNICRIRKIFSCFKKYLNVHSRQMRAPKKYFENQYVRENSR